MSEEDRRRWDRRYAEGGYTPRTAASPLLTRWLDHVPRGRALDLATGTGRNAIHLAEHGFDVTAIDVSAVAIDRARAAAGGLEVDWRVADLDEVDLGGPWDLVSVMRYRDVDLWPRVAASLAPDGWVLVEHHLQTSLDVAGPTTDAFRVAPGELLAAFGHLRVVHYEEVVESSDLPALPDAWFVTARIVAVNGNPGF